MTSSVAEDFIRISVHIHAVPKAAMRTSVTVGKTGISSTYACS
ncbi:hypothetical protein HMPREF3223_00005 [Cutibacterium avidum]|nr:hypothetical protein HMPREF3223_00005 [Cutibacterium avidum]